MLIQKQFLDDKGIYRFSSIGGSVQNGFSYLSNVIFFSLYVVQFRVIPLDFDLKPSRRPVRSANGWLMFVLI